jgi:hypothetical protein
MKCAITKEQQEKFVTHIVKDLMFIDNSNSEFDPIAHMSEIKTKMLESLKNWEGNKEELITDYLSELPSVYISLSSKPKVFSENFIDAIQAKSSEIYNLQKMSANVNRYEEFKNILFPAVSEEDILKSQEEFKEEFQREQEQNAENIPAPKAEPAKFTFSAKANSPLATTQQVAKDNVIDPTQLVYDEFLTNFTETEDLENFEYQDAEGNTLKGLRMRVTVIDDAVPLVNRRRTMTSDPQFGPYDAVLVFTNNKGETLYFEESEDGVTKAYTDITIPEGSSSLAMYYNLRSVQKKNGVYSIKEGKTNIQTPQEILETQLGGKDRAEEFKKEDPETYKERLKEITENQQAQFEQLDQLITGINNVEINKNKRELTELFRKQKSIPVKIDPKNITTRRSKNEVIGLEVEGIEQEITGYVPMSKYNEVDANKGFTLELSKVLNVKSNTYNNVIQIMGTTPKGDKVAIGTVQTTAYFSEDFLYVDFEGISSGFLPVQYKASTPTNEIVWDKSNVEFQVALAEKGRPVQNISTGEYYIPYNNIGIPLQLNSLSSDEINLIADIITDNTLTFTDINGTPKKLEVNEIFGYLAAYTNIFSKKKDGLKVYAEDIIINGETLKRTTVNKEAVVKYLQDLKPSYNISKRNTTNNNSITYFKREGNNIILRKENAWSFIYNNSIAKITPVVEKGEKVIKPVNRYVQFKPTQEVVETIKQEPTAEENKILNEINESVTTTEDIDNTIPGNFTTEQDTNINPEDLFRQKFELDTDPVNNKQAEEWIKNSPLLQNGITLNALFNVVNSNAYGSFKNGAITLWNGADYTVAYHEAWHAFSQHFLTKKEKINLYNYIAKTKEGKKALQEYADEKKLDVNQLTDLQKYHAVEELIAEDFRQYMMSKGSKIIKGAPERNTIFRRILNFLKELFTGKNGINELSKMYDNLRRGNLNNYTPSQQNRIFGENQILYKFKPVANNTHEFTQTELNTIVKTINGYFSEAINDKSKGTIQHFGVVSELPEKFLGGIYNNIQNKLSAKLNELNQIKDPTPEQLNTIKNLNGILDNWGDNKTGFINYHLEKTRALQIDPLIMDEEAFQVTEEDVDSSRFDVSANDLGVQKLASKSTNLLLSFLIDRNSKGEIIRNEYGAPELIPYNKAMGIVKGSLIGKRSVNEMIKALEDLSKQRPWVKDLLYKLKDHNNSNELSGITLKLRTSFFHSFNLNERNLHQTNINKIKEDGETSVEIVGGNVSAVDKIALNEFRSAFRTVEDHPYILETEEGNFLNINDLLRDYPEAPKTGADKLEFLHAIGLFLTDAPEVIKELDKVGMGSIPFNYIYNSIKSLKEFNDTTDSPILIENIVDFLQNGQYGPTVKKQDGTKTNLLIAQPQTGILKALADLHVKYSGNYANIALTTADGETQYLHGMRSTLDEQVDALNNAKSFEELIAIPFMSYLKPSKFFMHEANTFLKSLFEFDENTGTYGKRKTGVTLTVDSFTGVQTVNDRQTADYTNSVVAAKADKYTRLGADISNGLLYGKFTTTTHSDKSTVLTYYVNDLGILTKQNEPGHLHINPALFTESNTKGSEKITELLVPYLKGEWKRIQKVKAFVKDDTGNLERIQGVTVPDKNGRVKGTEWQYMSNIFSAEVLDKLENSDTFMVTDLYDQMIADVEVYIRNKTRETINYVENNFFIDKILSDKIKNLAGKELTDDQVKRAVLMGYQANYLFHQLASVSLFYGDISEYDMNKHDFLKRNAAVAASGRKFASYAEAIEWVNRKRTEENKKTYADKLGVSYGLSNVLNTGIISDLILDSKWVTNPDNKSILLEKYKKQIKSAQPEITTQQLNEAATNAVEKLISAYSNMEVGDAQGWISFDHYRKLRMLSDRWSTEQDALYYKIINNPKSVTVEEVRKAFPPDKYQYYGALDTENYNATGFHKFSLMPLIPTLVQGTPLETLHDNMVRKGITYVAHKTASKVSTIVSETNKTDDYYSFRENNESEDFEFTPNRIYLEYLKSQLDVNTSLKKKVIFSTQMRKLIIDGRYQDGKPLDERSAKVVADYENALSFFIDFRMMELKRELGIDPKDPTNTPDLPKLLSFIQKELTAQDLAEHHIDYIKTDSNGNLAFDLSVGLNSDQIEKSLLAIVNNRIVRQKVTGESLVQLSNAMMHKRKATPEELEKWGTRDLNYYVPNYFKDGSTLAAEVKISIANGNYKELFNLTSPIDNKPIGVYTNILDQEGNFLRREYNEEESLKRLNALIQTDEFKNDPEMLKLITLSGVRIPVQGHNSMEYFIVKEFLPAAAGPIIVPPAEIVAKSGSDFDIDKLSMLMPNIKVFGNKVVAISANKNITDMLKVPEMQEKLKTQVQELNEQRKTLLEQYANEVDAVFKDKLSPEDYAELNKRKNIFRKNKQKLEREIKQLNEEFTRVLSLKNYSEEEKEFIANYTDKVSELTNTLEAVVNEESLSIKEFGKNVKDTKLENVRKGSTAVKLDAVTKQLFQANVDLAGLSSKAFENELLFSISNMLSMEENFLSLITPNSTDMFKNSKNTGLADEMRKNRKYNPQTSVHENSYEKIKKNVSATNVLEPVYNINTHEQNAVGKDVLGIAAVANTFNVLFNRAGVKLKPSYKISPKIDFNARIKILLNHNSELNKNNEEIVSLSKIYNKDNVKISEILNQLINGFVDVAKDAWVFDVQGNKQLGPVLLFLVQAGVPVQDAVYFLSNPLIQEYVQLTKQSDSPYLVNTNFGARDKILGKFNVNPKQWRNEVNKYKKPWTRDQLKQMVDLNNPNTPTNLGVFLHFLELNEFTNQVTELVQTYNVDTSKQATLYDTAVKENSLSSIGGETSIFQDGTVQKILKESPIAPFKKAFDFQKTLWRPLFDFTADPKLNEAIIELKSKNRKEILNLFGTTDSFATSIKRDFLTKMFVTELKQLDTLQKNAYKNIPVVRTNAEMPVSITTDAKGNQTINLNEELLREQYDNGLYAAVKKEDSVYPTNSFQAQGYSPVSALAFSMDNSSSFEEFVNFTIERELLRQDLTQNKFQATDLFKDKLNQLKTKQPKPEMELSENYEKRLSNTVYENYLRDKALTNVFNYYQLFINKENNFAKQFYYLKSKYPELANDYLIINDLIPSSNITKNAKNQQGLLNLILKDNRVTPDVWETYNANVLELKDPNTKAIKNPNGDSSISFANKELQGLFEMLPALSLVQSGFDVTNLYSLVKAMPQDQLVITISNALKNNKSYDINEFYNEFVRQNSNRSKRRRFKNYQAINVKPVVSETIQPIVTETSINSKIISEDYGVVVVETNPDKTKTQNFVNIIQPQIQSQAYKENISVTANHMFMYGLRWTRKTKAFKPLNNKSYANKGLPITNALAKDGYVYDTLDQNGNPLAPISDLQSIITEIQSTLAIDMSNYDAVIGNIYLPGQNIATHRDTTESLSARNYPVVVYTIGNNSGISIYENEKNPGSASFANDKKTVIPTKNGSIYTFGMDGKGRFELAHDTPKGIKRNQPFPPITLPNGDVITNYTITLTFRRAADLTPGMPTAPAKLTTTQSISNAKNFNKKNLFTVTPQKGVSDEKAKVKASIATQYIGFGEDIVAKDGKRSSTQIYREQAGALANTGNYSSNDVIFVSVPGLRGTAEIAKREQDKTIKEAIKALEAGATILTDNKAYTDASSYNTGEKRLYKNLEAKKDYQYSEITIDGQVLGTWSKATTQASTSVKRGVEELFESNPELAKLGTVQQYSQYLDTIFPDSNYKSINYHGTSQEFKEDQFSKDKLGVNTGAKSAKEGFFFTDSYENADYYNANSPNKLYKEISFTTNIKDMSKVPLKYLDFVTDPLDGGEITIIKPEYYNIVEKEYPGIIKYNVYLESNESLSEDEFLKSFDTLKESDDYIESSKKEGFGGRVYAVKLNMQNTKKHDFNLDFTRNKNLTELIQEAKKENKDSVRALNILDPLASNVSIVFEPEQIHILGSKQDIQGFKEFVSKPGQQEVSLEETDISLETGTEDLFNLDLIAEANVIIAETLEMAKNNPEVKQKLLNFIKENKSTKIETQEQLEKLKNILC